MGQEKIFKVNQLPHPDLVTEEKVIYYNPTTRDIILKTPKGVKQFSSIVPPDSVDAFSINGITSPAIYLQLSSSFIIFLILAKGKVYCFLKYLAAIKIK